MAEPKPLRLTWACINPDCPSPGKPHFLVAGPFIVWTQAQISLMQGSSWIRVEDATEAGVILSGGQKTRAGQLVAIFQRPGFVAEFDKWAATVIPKDAAPAIPTEAVTVDA